MEKEWAIFVIWVLIIGFLLWGSFWDGPQKRK